MAQIVNRDELGTFPNGTVFTRYPLDSVDERKIFIMTGSDKKYRRWNGVISTTPSDAVIVGGKDEVWINWESTDDSSSDYDSDEEFLVLSSSEVKRIIDLLLWALHGYETPSLKEDNWICGNEEMEEHKFFDYAEGKSENKGGWRTWGA